MSIDKAKRFLFQTTGLLDTFGSFAFVGFVAKYQDVIYETIGGKVLAIFSFIMWTIMWLLNITGTYMNNVELFDLGKELYDCKGDIVKLVKTVIWLGGVYTNPMMLPVMDKKDLYRILTIYYIVKLFLYYEFWREGWIPEFA